MKEIEQIKENNHHGFNTHEIYITNFNNWKEIGYYIDIYKYEGWNKHSFIVDSRYINLFTKHIKDRNEKELVYFL